MNEDLADLTVNEFSQLKNHRFIIVDKFRRVWNGRRFDSIRSKARIYHTTNEATMVALDLARSTKPKSNFIVLMMIEVLSDEPVPIAELLKSFFHATHFSAETRNLSNREGLTYQSKVRMERNPNAITK